MGINEAQKPLKLNKQGRNRHNQTWDDIFGQAKPQVLRLHWSPSLHPFWWGLEQKKMADLEKRFKK